MELPTEVRPQGTGVVLRKHERRKLEEIENQLKADPELVRSMGGAHPRWLPSKSSPSAVLGSFSAILAALCLFLGEGAGFAAAGALAALLLSSRMWHVHT